MPESGISAALKEWLSNVAKNKKFAEKAARNSACGKSGLFPRTFGEQEVCGISVISTYVQIILRASTSRTLAAIEEGLFRRDMIFFNEGASLSQHRRTAAPYSMGGLVFLGHGGFHGVASFSLTQNQLLLLNSKVLIE